MDEPQDAHMQSRRTQVHAVAESLPNLARCYTRHQALLAAIHNFPARLNDLFQQKANSIIDDMRGEVDAALQHVAWGSEDNEIYVGKVADTFKLVPDKIFRSFATCFVRAQSTVKERIKCLIQGVDNMEFTNDNELAWLWTLPKEVEGIVGESYDEAMPKLQVYASGVLDEAVASLPAANALNTATISTMKQHMWTKVLGLYPDAFRAAMEMARGTLEHAIAAVEDNAVPPSIPNEVVADALLRAKARYSDGAGGLPSHGSPSPFLCDRHADGSSHAGAAGKVAQLAPGIEESFKSAETAETAESEVSPRSSRDSCSLSGRGKPLRAASVHDSGLSTVVTTIVNMPSLVEEALQHKAINLVQDRIESKLVAMRRLIRRDESCDDICAEEAVARLNMIPDIIRSSLTDNIFKVKGTVRKRVKCVIQDLENNKVPSEQIVTQLWTIPEEIEQIAGEAVKEALQESQKQASRQLDYALESLPEAAMLHRAAASDVNMNIGHVYPETLRAARATAEVNVEHAIAAVVRSRTRGREKAPENADHIFAGVGDSTSRLRRPAGGFGNDARAREAHAKEAPQELAASMAGVQQSVAAPRDSAPGVLPVAAFTNPGSLGHPHLCGRPCIYHQQGTCMNSSACNFCHAPHPQRPVHLGTRHRRMLELMPVKDSMAIALPVLEQKLQALNLPVSSLNALRLFGNTPQRASDRSFRPRIDGVRSLRKALQAMCIRSIINTLRSTTVPRGGPEQAMFVSLAQSLRHHVQPALCDIADNHEFATSCDRHSHGA